MGSRANLVAHTVISQFNKLPAKRKPAVRDNGIHDWVPLSGIVAEQDGVLTCLALATGMKCLPSSKIHESDGVGLHDWHAEILAIRTFNRFLLDECHSAIENGNSKLLSTCLDSDNVPERFDRPFQVKDNVRLHMYCSEAPCGDASMEIIMAAQNDSSPWDVPPAASDSMSSQTELPGRAYFSQLGVVRRKPARGDAPPTLSKSCSDKLASKQCTSLLSSLSSLFVDPANAYIDTLVLPDSQHSSTACERAFSSNGRMSSVASKAWPGGYSFQPFNIETTDVEFEYSKRSVAVRSSKTSASNLAAAWSLSGAEESIIGGVLQGRKPFSHKGASRMSRRQMWQSSRDLAAQLRKWPEIGNTLSVSTYGDVKKAQLLAQRRQVKADVRSMALTGWIRNDGDSSFTIGHDATNK